MSDLVESIKDALVEIDGDAEREVVGFTIVCEWETPDGERFLTTINPGHPSWAIRGYLSDALSRLG